MIHNATCNIVIDPPLPKMQGVELSIPTDDQIAEVFPDWQLKQRIFISRCCQIENKEMDQLTPRDWFRYGMKFIICEAKNLV